MPPQTQKREIAHIISIENLKKHPYYQQEGWLSNYIEFHNKKISRVNIMGGVILKPISENMQFNLMIVDDGTDQIEVRTFEQDFDFNEYSIGEVVNVVGRIREFGNNRYIVPEIIKKINNLQILKLRKKQLRVEELKHKRNKTKKTIKTAIIEGEKIEENKILSTYNKIIDEIKKLDRGDGANIQDILININVINGEELITELLQKGNIFEISPGKVKILE